jgi:uncharacterized protein YrrD
MDETRSTTRWTEIRGRAVVSLDNGKKVGTCDDFYFDPQSHEVYALRVKTGLLSHHILPAAQVKSVGQDAITIQNEEALQKRSEDKKIDSLPSVQSELSFKVMSASGTLIGTVGNILLHINAPATLQVAGYELAGGLREKLGGRYASFAAEQIMSYGTDVIVIPDDIAQTLK